MNTKSLTSFKPIERETEDRLWGIYEQCTYMQTNGCPLRTEELRAVLAAVIKSAHVTVERADGELIGLWSVQGMFNRPRFIWMSLMSAETCMADESIAEEFEFMQRAA